jgi:hypothetical protein
MAHLEYSEHWARLTEQRHDAYMDALYQAAQDGEDMETLSGIPFCGECSECERRESWVFLMMEAVKAHRCGILNLVE